MGKHTIIFNNAPRINITYTIAGPKESEGPLGQNYNLALKDDRFGEKTYEKAERKMLERVVEEIIDKSTLKREEIDLLVSGDLLNQIVSASFTARREQIPYLGLYGACSTMSESIIVSAILVDGRYMHNVIACTGSHFSSAERQYRYPLELGCTRPPSSQWTVTGAGGCLIQDKGNGPKITMATFGKVIDYGVVDVNNMGAAMAPAACDTLCTHFKETNRTEKDYDLILTGDLGVLGSKLFVELMQEKGYDVEKVHDDCGKLVYEKQEDEFQGGSGAGCSAIVFNSYIIDKLRKKEYKRIIFMATGTLMSSLTSQQGDSIPSIAHLVVLESED